MELRDYQTSAVRAIRARMRKHQRVVAVAPTGSGKSVIAAAVVASMPRMRVLWIAHRIELLRQARQHLFDAGLDEVGMLSGTEHTYEGRRVVVASIDSLRTRPWPGAQLIIVDEAHRIEAASYQMILAAAPDAKVLGLTATPWRLDGQGLGNTFDDMLVMADITDLMVDGFIARPITYGVPLDKAKQMVKGVKSTGGDYAAGALGKAMMKGTLVGDVVQETQRLAPGVPTLVFACSRDHARALQLRFSQTYRNTAYLDGDTSAEDRERMLTLLGSGKLEVVVNVDVLTEGFDCPPVKCIVIARPTKSLTRFLQYTGRAARPFRGKRPIILDHAGNCYRHGLPDAPRAWSLDDLVADDAVGGEPPAKQCVNPDCMAMIAAGAFVCPECGTSQPRPAREIEEEKAALERLRATEAERAARLVRLNALAQRRGLSDHWVQQTMQHLTT